MLLDEEVGRAKPGAFVAKLEDDVNGDVSKLEDDIALFVLGGPTERDKRADGEEGLGASGWVVLVARGIWVEPFALWAADYSRYPLAEPAFSGLDLKRLKSGKLLDFRRPPEEALCRARDDDRWESDLYASTPSSCFLCRKLTDRVGARWELFRPRVELADVSFDPFDLVVEVGAREKGSDGVPASL